MNPEQFKRLKDIFIAYQELDPDERSLYLEKACRGDEELRVEAEKLFASSGDDDRFLEEPALVPTAAETIEVLEPGTLLGDFRLGRMLYDDATHSEYEARGEDRGRQLTATLFKPGIVRDAALGGFDHKLRELAKISHPNLARIVGGGLFAPTAPPPAAGSLSLPYMVAEAVVDALPITEFARLKNLPLRNRLELFLQAADAVHHGHGHGVLHRDLHPSAIVVDVTEKVTVVNFGIVHAVDLDIVLAAARAELGGLFDRVQYWSPEQCRADLSGIDCRTDVYALGMILYELLCDERPYDVRPMPFARAAHTIETCLLQKPSLVNRATRGDLEAIVLRALEKQGSCRFQNVAELADDIGRYLDGACVQAKRAAWIDKIGKTITRFVTGPIARFLDRRRR